MVSRDSDGDGKGEENDEDDEIDRVDEGKHLETISGAVSHKGLSHTHMVAMHIKCT